MRKRAVKILSRTKKRSSRAAVLACRKIPSRGKKLLMVSRRWGRKVERAVGRAVTRLADAVWALRELEVQSLVAIARAIGWRRLAAAVLVAGILNVYGLGTVAQTLAYYSDTESSGSNSFAAATLDMTLDGGSGFSPLSINKGESTSRGVTVASAGTLAFQYKMSVENLSGDADLCDALTFQATPPSGSTFSGALAGYVSATTTTLGLWNFTVALPGGAADSLQDKGCSFDFVYTAWQEALPDPSTGFSDVEELSNTISSGHWVVTEPGDDSVSPIADSRIEQEHGNSNYGTDQDLKIQSRSGSKNIRTLVKFDFHFPSGITINSSALKLYMKDAPSASRSYQARRILDSWIEHGAGSVTWNNQPAANAAPTAAAGSGTTKNLWLSWDIKSDVQAVVDGTNPNYGWLLQDSAENADPKQEAVFNSRESDSETQRPVLEVSFSAPPAATSHAVINEVFSDVGSYGNDPRDEWVELYNPTSSSVNLSGWRICDNSGCDTIGSYTLSAKGFGVIVTSTSHFDDYWILPPGAVKIVLGDSKIGGGGLANSGDKVELKDNGGGGGALIDAMSYGSNTTYLSLPTSGSGKSLARIIKGYDTDTAADWIINATPNPGTNPGSDGEEIMRFTGDGVEVASTGVGLTPLPGEELSLAEEVPAADQTSTLPAVNDAAAVDALQPAVTLGAAAAAAVPSSTPEVLGLITTSTPETTPLPVVNSDESSSTLTSTTNVPSPVSADSVSPVTTPPASTGAGSSGDQTPGIGEPAVTNEEAPVATAESPTDVPSAITAPASENVSPAALVPDAPTLTDSPPAPLPPAAPPPAPDSGADSPSPAN